MITLLLILLALYSAGIVAAITFAIYEWIFTGRVF